MKSDTFRQNSAQEGGAGAKVRREDRLLLFEMATRPDWLLPPSDDVCWFFRPDVPGYAESHYTVRWPLDDESHRLSGNLRYWIRIAQRVLIAYGTSPDFPERRVTTLVDQTRHLRSFVVWIANERTCASLGRLVMEDVEAYEEYVAGLDLTSGTVEQKLGVLRIFWQCASLVGEEMGCRPYRFRGELKRVAKLIGRPGGHTRTLPPNAYFCLMDHALHLVAEGERWVELGDRYQSMRRDPALSGSNFQRKFREMYGIGAYEVIRQCRWLYGACLVLIFSLMGMRKHEVAILSVEDVRCLLCEEKADLHGRVTKSSNGSGGEETTRPCPDALRRAIVLAAQLTGQDLETSSGPFFRPIRLDQSIQAKHDDHLDSGKIYRLIEGVAGSAKVDLTIRPHMFRRAFSMIYVWRYEFGDLAYLTRFLYHNDIRHTLAYVCGDDTAEFMSDAKKALAHSIMERALLGAERFGGGFGRRLERIAHRLRATVAVLKPEQIDNWVDAIFGRQSIQVQAGPQGYCIIVGDRGKKAMCSTDGRQPNYANRTDDHCACCGNFCLPERAALHWAERFENHRKVFVSSRIKVMKEAAKKGMSLAKRMLHSLGRKKYER